ncbi:MAG TPA: hypothetical protein VJL07_04790 [Dehalococcoidia bacterium]|nr:hypothetical protein [Dehalococcoidia bacterium]
MALADRRIEWLARRTGLSAVRADEVERHMPRSANSVAALDVDGHVTGTDEYRGKIVEKRTLGVGFRSSQVEALVLCGDPIGSDRCLAVP